MQAAPHIVVVEDEAVQRRILASLFSGQGFRVTEFDHGRGLRLLLEHESPALVLLDVLLPDENGFSLARFVRARTPHAGIIMISAAGETVDRVVGLESGADDYLAKPFQPRELLARAHSVLRRVAAGHLARSERTVRVGRRVFDRQQGLLLDNAGEADASGCGERLAAGELALLRAFIANPYRPLEREWLMEVTSHRDRTEDDRAIDLRVARLRRKVEHDATRPRAIRTVRGVGYMFVPEREHADSEYRPGGGFGLV